MEAALALCENRIAPAEAMLRAHLKQHPTDVAAIRMLAEVAARLGRYGDAEVLLERALELAPSFEPARMNYAFVLHRSGKSEQALVEVDRAPRARSRQSRLPQSEGGHSGPHRRGRAVDRRCTRRVTREYPNHPKVWMSFGHALKTAGRQDECIDAYRRSLELVAAARRSMVESRESQDRELRRCGSRQRCEQQLGRSDLTPEDRFHFHFALGKALEDAGRYEASFEHYARAMHCVARSSRTMRRRTPGTCSARRRCSRRSSSRSAAAAAAQAPDPIFIVGLPRSGSTLIEQILASHPLVEGTQELPDVVAIARELGETKKSQQRLRSIRRCWRRSAARNCAPWASAICVRLACNARPAPRSSSTRCRTTGLTSG